MEWKYKKWRCKYGNKQRKIEKIVKIKERKKKWIRENKWINDEWSKKK